MEQLSEKLFEACKLNILPFVKVNLQHRTYSSSNSDEAPLPYVKFFLFTAIRFRLINFFKWKKKCFRLLTVNKTALDSIPTIDKMCALFDNYEMDSSLSEKITPDEEREVEQFIDELLNTSVMKIAMQFLYKKGE